uniref:Uncharacterized protein n=1 Tax=Inoviridae sp. ctO6A5 TaxID=2826760 RepID=A0A8S5M546_9VIRU|nr:MAG TPA: hypothetical protein [Inoviridae sp. ctO6A5]
MGLGFTFGIGVWLFAFALRAPLVAFKKAIS